jgi:glyoxylase-like metal-dependent hydrolase (beta-lactamase superfamily II)
MANHLSFAWRGALFSGDMVMGWSTSLVSPPDGDMTAFMASLDRLGARADRVYYPGHGDPVTDPQSRVAELIAHAGPRGADSRRARDGRKRHRRGARARDLHRRGARADPGGDTQRSGASH